MPRKDRETIYTPHGTATYYKRGKNYSYAITLTNIKIPKNKRRIRKTLGCVSESCIEEKIKLDISERIKKLKKGIYVDTKPIKYIQTTYIPKIQEWTADNKPTGNDRGTWNPKKLRDDTTAITKYIIPFLEDHKLDWEDLTKPKAMIDFNRLLDKHKLSKSSKKKRRAVFNSIAYEARLDELLEHKLEHPDLPKDKKKKGQRLNSFAFPTEQMIFDLLEVAEIEKDNTNGKAKTIWNRTVCYHWLRILLDTGIRPFNSIPFYFSDLDRDGNHIVIDRNEKGIDYDAQGAVNAIAAFNALRLMYQQQGFEPIHILSNQDGTKATTTNKYLTSWLRKANWTVDADGREYKAHSIRKYHITTACHYRGEDRETYKQIADRVGHSVKTLLEYYVEPFQRKDTRPKGLTQALTPNKKVITNISDYA